MFDKASDFRYVSFRDDSGELIDLNLSVDLLPLRTDDKHAILAGKDIAFLYESITERKFATARGSADDIVSFSRKLVTPSFPALSTHPAPDPGYRNRLVTYALDESVTIPRVVYTDESAGGWSDFIEKASIPRVTVEELPITDGRAIRKEPVLAAFDNQAKLNRFYTPNLSTVRDVTNMRVEAYNASTEASVAYTESLYPESDGNIYPPSVTASTEDASVQVADGEIIAFKRRERTYYNGNFGDGGIPGTNRFLKNIWSSRCITYAANTSYDLYNLSPGINIAVGAKYRAVFHFAYSQSYTVQGFDDESKNYSGDSSGYGYLIGDEATVPEYNFLYVPRSNVFASEVLSDIRRHYQKIDPISNGFMNPTNAPRWDDLFHDPYSTYPSYHGVYANFRRNYDDSIVLKPLGYIVTLGNHTRWKS